MSNNQGNPKGHTDACQPGLSDCCSFGADGVRKLLFFPSFKEPHEEHGDNDENDNEFVGGPLLCRFLEPPFTLLIRYIGSEEHWRNNAVSPKALQ